MTITPIIDESERISLKLYPILVLLSPLSLRAK